MGLIHRHLATPELSAAVVDRSSRFADVVRKQCQTINFDLMANRRTQLSFLASPVSLANLSAELGSGVFNPQDAWAGLAILRRTYTDTTVRLGLAGMVVRK